MAGLKKHPKCCPYYPQRPPSIHVTQCLGCDAPGVTHRPSCSVVCLSCLESGFEKLTGVPCWQEQPASSRTSKVPELGPGLSRLPASHPRVLESGAPPVSLLPRHPLAELGHMADYPSKIHLERIFVLFCFLYLTLESEVGHLSSRQKNFNSSPSWCGLRVWRRL